MLKHVLTPTRRTAAASLMAAAFAFGAAFSGAGGSHATAAAASKASAASAGTIIDAILTRNPGLRTYAAHTTLDIRQVNFPYLHPVLQGMEYYTSPGFTLFDFPHTPSYLKGITKVESTAYAVARWQRCYDITVDDLPNSYVLHMVPRIPGQVSRVDVVVTKADSKLQRFDWWYVNPGDHASLSQTYSTVDGYNVVTRQESDLALHHIRAVGTSEFSSFQYNVPVPTPTPTPSDPLHQCDN